MTDEREAYLGFNGHESWLRDHLVRCLHGEALYVEAGAHIGTHAMRMCRHCQRVVAFEPNGDNRRLLMANVGHNGATNLEIRMFALASRPGYAWFHHGPHPGADFMSWDPEFSGNEQGYPAGSGYEQVVTTTLDLEFPHQVIDLLKIDVEGFEAEVLAGATQLLAEKRLRAIVVEFHDQKGGAKVNSIVDSLKAQGFQATSIAPDDHPQDYFLFRL